MGLGEHIQNEVQTGAFGCSFNGTLQKFMCSVGLMACESEFSVKQAVGPSSDKRCLGPVPLWFTETVTSVTKQHLQPGYLSS